MIPDGDPLSSALQLILNWKVSGPLVKGASLVLIAMQLLKAYFGDFNYKRTVTAVLSCVYTLFVVLQTPGMDLVSAVILVFVTYGGALLVYDSFKTPLNKVVGLKDS